MGGTSTKGLENAGLVRVPGLSVRQQVNIRYRQLKKGGLVIRRRIDGKVHRFRKEDSLADNFLHACIPG